MPRLVAVRSAPRGVGGGGVGAAAAQLVAPYFAFEVMVGVWDDGGATATTWMRFIGPLLFSLVRVMLCACVVCGAVVVGLLLALVCLVWLL